MGENLAGWVAVVTGGASGIGEVCATRLAGDGANVVVADLNAGAATAVAERIGGRAVEVDLAADFDAAALAGQADVLVNCAGLQHVAPVHEFPPQIADQARIHGISEDRVIEEIMLTEPAIKRLIEPAEIAELVAYLCSAPASFANGSSYVLDGGWSAR